MVFQEINALAIEGALVSEVAFPPAREGHGMIGSGLYVANPPWGLEAATAEIAGRFAQF